MKLEKVDLSSVTITGMIESLETDISDATKIITTINAFITEIETGNNLYGESYTKVKNKLSEYITMLEKRKTTADALKTAINNAINQMKSYIGDDYDGLDEAKLPELNEIRQKAVNWVASLTEEIKAEPSEETKKELERQLYSPSELIKQTDREIAKIEGLTDADKYEYGILESAISKILEYDTTVNSLQETKITML